MNPEQFIREQGLDAVKDCIEEAEAYGGFYVNAKTLELSKHIPSYDAVSITGLKRLVESLDIINDLGGMEKLTPYFITTDKRLGYTHVRMGGNNRLCFLDDFCDFIPDDAISIKSVMTAIRDHESIYGGGDD
ncbi:hypothetical protein [Acinetobacter baumannii]|uniref:hypothetical protein n=1 Tax=Acinetobacter baumannii TaxID=470 RepID=UPI003AFAAB32